MSAAPETAERQKIVDELQALMVHLAQRNAAGKRQREAA